MRIVSGRKTLACGATAAMWLAVLGEVALAQVTNITSTLNNASFDSVVVPAWTTGVPSGWDGSGDTSKFGLGPACHDGAQGLFFNFGGGWRGVQQASTYQVQRAGEVLSFSTWVKVDNHAGPPNVVWFNEQITLNGNAANQVQPAYTATTDWTQVTVSYTAEAADVGKTVGVALGFQSDGWAQTFADQLSLTTTIEVQLPSLTWNNGAGTFAWNTADANWSGSAWNNTTPTMAIFGATGVGSVAVTEAITNQNIVINQAGYTLADGGGTLTVNGAITNNAETTLSATLSGGLTLEGTGNLTLAALATYSGDTVINGGQLTIDASSGGLYYSGNGKIRVNAGGTLSLSGSLGYGNQALHFIEPSASSIVINGGIYQHTGPSNPKSNSGAGHLFSVGALGATLDSATIGEEFTLGYRYDYQAPGLIGSAAGGTLTLTGQGDGELNYLLAGSGGLVKTGAGTWKLSNINTYSGDTVIKAGTLALANGTANGGQGAGSITSPNITLSAGASFDVSLATGGFTLGASQSLLGDGTVIGAVTTSAGSRIFAGLDEAYGTLTFQHDLSLASGSSCSMDLGSSADGPNDLLVVNGNLLLNGPVFHLKAPAPSAAMDTTKDYVLAKVAGTISGGADPMPVWDIAPVNAANLRVLKVGNNLVLRNVTGTPPTATATATPATATHFDNVTVRVTVTPGSSAISSVVMNATPIAGPAAVALVNEGGNVYTGSVVVGGSAPLGADSVLITITDVSLLTATVTLPVTLISADRVWNGEGVDDYWSTTANWVAGVGPGLAGDGARFAGTKRLTPELERDYAVSGMVFDVTAGSFVVGGANATLTLTGSGVSNESSNTQDIEVPIRLAAPQTFNTAGGDLILGKTVTGGAGVTKTGKGNLTLATSCDYSGPTIIQGGTLVVGSKLYANGGGPIQINAGGVLSLPSGDIGWGASLGFLDVTASKLVINGGTLRHTGAGNGQTVSGAGHLFTIGALGATLDSATPGETFSLGFRYDYTPILTSSEGGTLTLTGEGDGVMDYTLPGSGGVKKTGTGHWTLTRSDNSFTGDVVVKAGTLTIASATLAPTATVFIDNNAMLDLGFGEVNRIGALVIGQVPMPPGTYNASSLPGSLTGSGSLLVTGAAHPQLSVGWSGSSMTISWPEGYTGWKLQVQTQNLSAGVSLNPADWELVEGSTTTHTMVLPIDAKKPSAFYKLSN